MKKIKVDRYLIVTICTFLLMISSFTFLQQVFIKNFSMLGGSVIALNGYEVIFGTTKVLNPPSTPIRVETTRVFSGHPLLIVSFVLLCLATILQIVEIILKIKQKTQTRISSILNLVSSICFVISGFILFFSKSLFYAANTNVGSAEFSTVGTNTSAICILMTGVIALLNSADLVNRNSKYLG